MFALTYACPDGILFFPSLHSLRKGLDKGEDQMLCVRLAKSLVEGNTIR